MEKDKNIAQQLLFWCFLWMLIPLMFSGLELVWKNLLRIILLQVGVIVLLLLNLKVLLPRLFFSKKKALYALMVLVSVFVLSRLAHLGSIFFIEGQVFEFGFGRPPFAENQERFFRGINFTVPFLITMIGSALYEISQFAAHKEQEAVQLRAEKLEAEIKFLKSQINPHFLFNALNNIYTLTLLKSEAAPDNLLKLSAMLRYMLYDCAKERVPLKKEIEYLKNFVDLMRLKDSSSMDIQLDFDESSPDMSIAPMLFVPFVENAFKHGELEKKQGGKLKIAMHTKGKRLVFQIKNTLPIVPKSKDPIGGIGLENVRRQLELLYPNSHQLDIGAVDGDFVVKMVLDTE